MELYGQDAEARLLAELVPLLDRPTMIDAGAERGSLAVAMLEAGIGQMDAVEAHPDNAQELRRMFASDARVRVHECALSDADGDGVLHVSAHPDGATITFGHTLLERDDTDEIKWGSTVPVRRRTLASLIAAGEIPGEVGILKIDTEGHDLAVVRGMGELAADVVMVEHWSELPHGLGGCPWTAEEMVAELRSRGFANFAFLVHRGEFVTVKWNDAGVESGAMGNLVFLHDRVLAKALPAILRSAASLAERAVAVGQAYMQAADDRLALIAELHEVAADRLAEIKGLQGAASARLDAL